MKKSNKKKSPLLSDLLTLLILAIITAAELYVMNVMRGSFDYKTYSGVVACLTVFLSIPVGVLASVLICVATRKNSRARDHSYAFFVIRLLAMLAVSATLIYMKGAETPEAFPDGELAGGVVGFAIGLALALAGQMFIAAKILDNMLIPPYESTAEPEEVNTAGSTGSAPSSSSDSYSSSAYPSDAVKETEYYKRKHSEYYDMYMGRPHEEKKTEVDVIDHDYSHIFEDTNF